MMKIDVKELEQALHALNLESVVAYFEQLTTRLEAIAHVDSYQGRTARKMKSYFKEVHGLATKSFTILLMEIDTGLKRVRDNMRSIDVSDDALLNSDYLLYLKELIDGYRKNFLQDAEEVETAIRRANAVMPGVTPHIDTRNASGSLENSSKHLYGLVEQMDSLNQHELRQMESLEDHLYTLIQAINHIEETFTGNIANFVSGSFLSSPLGQSLFEHMIESAASLARSGSHQDTIVALSIIGGFISTLPPHLRKTFEQLKGRTLLCALIGDPINASTGSFIDEQLDIETGGRYSLTFKRFYNSVDAYEGPLGRNWRHTYDIKLTKEKDGSISIANGEGHRTYYYLERNKDKQAPRCYKPHVGVLNVLKEQKDGFELKLHSGGQYHFNSQGQLVLQIDETGNKITLTYDDDLLQKVETKSGFLTFTYQHDYIHQVTDHTGRKMTYDYEAGTLTTVTDVSGNQSRYHYDERQRLLSKTKPNGHVSYQNKYDNKDRVISQTYADGTNMAYMYREYKKETTFTKQNGSKVTYRRDEDYRTTGIIYPDGEEKIEYNFKNQRSKFIDKMGHVTQFGYDKSGNLTKVINALGVVTELTYMEGTDKVVSITIDGEKKIHNTYDNSGNLIHVEDALNNQTEITYTAKNLPRIITQADGSQIQLQYDEKGNITEVTDATGVITKYHYDQLNRVIATSDANNNKTNFSYDLQGNITAVKNAAGHTQSFEYTTTNKIAKITDFNGATTTREYNPLGKLSKITDPLNRETSFGYDRMWNISTITEANGAVTQLYYNEMNRLEVINKPDESQIAYAYDSTGNLIAVGTDDENVTHLSYDKLGQLIRVKDRAGLKLTYTYNNEGQITSVTDALENTVYLEYNVLGQLTRETNALGDSRVYTYTSLGKIAMITDEANRVTTYGYERGGRLKNISHPDGTNESFTYHNTGNLKTHTNKLAQTTYTYDCLSRVISITTGTGTKRYTYDRASNVTSMTDELENTTHYEYTLTGQLAKVTDALNNETFYAYDIMDNLIEIRQEGSEVLGHDGVLDEVTKLNEAHRGLRITKYHRNIMGQVEAVEDASGNKETYTYTNRGELLEKIDKDGYLTKYNYTGFGAIKHIQYADGKEVKLQYNALRQLTEIQDWLGVTKIEVDPLGRATTITNHNDEVVSYSYGKLGERESITYPCGKQVSYSFDNALRLTKVTDGDQEINYHYDQLNRLTNKQFTNGMSTNYAYNNLGQLSTLTHLTDAHILDSYKYDYDHFGNKTSIEKMRPDLAADTGLFTYTYDPLHRLSEVSKDGKSLRSYSYDAFGNRTSMTSDDEKITYTFNPLNQLISSTDGMRYHYDKRGNQVEVFKNGNLINKHHFGALNRLEQSFNHEKELSSIYQYSGLGHRTGQTIGDLNLNPVKEIENILDYTRGFHNLLQRKENGAIQQFTYDFGVLSAQNGEQTLNYLHDELGSPIRLIDGIGSELDAFGYDEFGVQFGTTSCVKQPFGFTGYSTDSVSDTLFAQAREYDPVAGRFISEDLIKGFTHAPLTQNTYNYVWNNPLNLVDFNGMYPELPYGHLDPAIYCQETGIPHGASVPIGANMDIRRELRAVRDWFGRQRDAISNFVDDHIGVQVIRTDDISSGNTHHVRTITSEINGNSTFVRRVDRVGNPHGYSLNLMNKIGGTTSLNFGSGSGAKIDLGFNISFNILGHGGEMGGHVTGGGSDLLKLSVNTGTDHNGTIIGNGFTKGFNLFYSQTAAYSYLKRKEDGYTVKSELGVRFPTWQFYAVVGATVVVAVFGGKIALLASTATMGGLGTAATVVAISALAEFISNNNNDECNQE